MLWFYIQVALSALLGGKRSLREDGLRTLARLPVPVEIRGRQNIPAQGPRLLTVNHYKQAGFKTWWLALGIAAQLPVEVPWLMAAYWREPRHMRLLTRWFFPLLAKVYGFVLMPPMPPWPEETAARAQSVRRVLTLARENPEMVLGLAPEGGDQDSGALIELPNGVGRFILLLMPYCQKITPVGVFFEGERLVYSFGEAYELQAPAGLSPDERDQWAREVVMHKIAELLPEELRTLDRGSPSGDRYGRTHVCASRGEPSMRTRICASDGRLAQWARKEEPWDLYSQPLSKMHLLLFYTHQQAEIKISFTINFCLLG